MTKIHELNGQILSKEQKKVYDKKSPYCGNIYYRLKVLAEKEQIFFVYPNLVSSEIFQTIQQSQYLEKRYWFTCIKRKSEGWVLQNWKELSSS